MKKISLILLALILICSLFYYLYISPKDITRTLEGIEYPIGSNTGDVNEITIHIEGKRYHSFLGIIGEEKFEGQLFVEGISFYTPPENTKTVIRFDAEGRGDMRYVSNKTGLPIDNVGYGYLYVDRDFRKVTIAEAREDGNGRSWLSWDGWMITAPADKKAEALIISNELMKDVLHEELE